MSEGSIGSELGIMGKLKKAVGFGQKNNQSQPIVSSTPQPEGLNQILEGKNDARTDPSWRGPGVGQNDSRIIMGEQRATSPGQQDLEARKLKEAGMPVPESAPSQPTYIAQGTQNDNLEVPKMPQGTPPNIIQFPTPTEAPLEKPAA